MNRRLLFIVSTLVVTAFVCGIHFESVHADDEVRSKLLQTFVAEFVQITPGEGQFPASFDMGGPNRRPLHTVKMARPFAIAKYEVPQNLYTAVMGKDPSRWKGPRNSVEMMTWDEAKDFCEKITVLLQEAKLIHANELVRLPTESEWEYCCRAGTSTSYSFGEDAQQKGDVAPVASLLNEYGWHTGNAAGNDPPVGALKPNPWGLYDMHGYLWEFTQDAWSSSYDDGPTDGTEVKPKVDTKEVVIRSGSWKDDFNSLTSSARRRMLRSGKDDAVGFRCVKSKQIK